MKQFLTLLLALLVVLAFGCGRDHDKSTTNINVPQQENPSPNPTPSPSGPPRVCLTNSQRENIRTFMNRLADLRVFNGTAQVTTRNPDGTTTTTPATATLTFVQDSTDSWSEGQGITTPDVTSDGLIRFVLKDGCLFSGTGGDRRARVSSSSDSNLTFSFTDADGSRESIRMFFSGGAFRDVEVTTKNNVTTFRFDFTQQ